MKIRSMTATFGKLEQQTLTLEPGLNVIQAPNEWGKSTWCAFLVAMLYGIETRSHTTKSALADKERYAPWSGSPMEGRLELEWQGRNITIERRTKGRIPFGMFRAYETDTGLEIPELTAANCGQILLGVEKSVFLRSGFLHLEDLPVAQDEALRRRLNALVTTGEENGAAEALSQQLRELKNRCRLNRNTGLLPQAQARCRELEASLEELISLRDQAKKLRQRQAQLETHRQTLENHQLALEYEQSLTYHQSLREARAARDHAQQALARQQMLCSELPQPDHVERNLLRCRQLRDQRDALLLERQLLEPATDAWQPHPALAHLPPEDAVNQVKSDLETLDLKARFPWYWLLLTVLGSAALAIPNSIARIGGLVSAVLGIILLVVSLSSNAKKAKAKARLLEKYAPLQPNQWLAAAEDYAIRFAQQQSKQDSYRREQEALDRQLRDLNSELEALSQTDWEAARQDYDGLSAATREYRRAEDLVRTLENSQRQVQAPSYPDEMTYTAQETARLLSDCALEQRQLQLKLGTVMGRMETLDTEDTLTRQLQTEQARVAALEDTCAALELAQDTLARAASELQRRFAPELSRRAQDLFSQLTDGQYDRLTLSEDLSLLTGSHKEATLRSPLWRSSGTTDQLYLALRLALSETLTPQAPLVLDDALVRFDDHRLKLTLDALQEISKGKQILLFTCQSREKQFLPRHTPPTA